MELTAMRSKKTTVSIRFERDVSANQHTVWHRERHSVSIRFERDVSANDECDLAVDELKTVSIRFERDVSANTATTR